MGIQILTLFFVVCFLFSFIGDSLAGAKKMMEIYHGTLNLSLGNKNCMVVATDSRATKSDQHGKVINREDNHQKLFQITKDVAVAIAGYNKVSVHAAPEFTAPAAAIIIKYTEEIKQRNHIPGYHEVVQSLSYLINFHLSSVANINLWSIGHINRGNYIFQMIIVGKDNNIRKMTKLTIVSAVSPGAGNIPCVSSNVIDTKESIVENDFVFESAGCDNIAKDVLKNPNKYSNYKAAQSYEAYIREGKSSEISCSEMVELVKTIMQITAQNEQGVGGPIQSFIFKKEETEICIPNFPPPKDSPINFNMVMRSSLRGERAILIKGSQVLWVSNSIQGKTENIDNNFYFGNTFTDCKIVLNGNNFGFDKSNIVKNCELEIVKNIDMNSLKIKSLINEFKWRKITKIK